jgi:ketosteroid isomerase-like protein
MSEQSNLQSVHDIFAAFARNDIDAAMKRMAEDVDWQNLGPAEMGYTTPRRGRAQVREFFKLVDELFDHEQFNPVEFVAQGDKVVVAGTERVRVKPNGESFLNTWCMIFTFNSQGLIAKWRCYEDTARVLDAMRAAKG